MAYEKQTWKDGEEGNTPLSAERLNHIEDGLSKKAEKYELDGLVDTSDLDDYAKKTDLDKKADNSELSNYAKTSDLEGLAEKSELEDYAKNDDLADKANQSDLDSLISRVEALEEEE